MANYQPKNAKSCELDTGALNINKDGWKFNVARFWHELVWCYLCTRGDWKRLFSNWRIDHNLTNIVTESLRCAPYLWAHVIVIGFVLWLVYLLFGAG